MWQKYAFLPPFQASLHRLQNNMQKFSGNGLAAKDQEIPDVYWAPFSNKQLQQ